MLCNGMARQFLLRRRLTYVVGVGLGLSRRSLVWRARQLVLNKWNDRWSQSETTMGDMQQWRERTSHGDPEQGRDGVGR
jgi:kynureninase